MAKKEKEYSSIIDAFLDDREPDWKELGLKDALKSGEEQLSRTHEHVDVDFLDELAEGKSHHTTGPKGGRGGRVASVPDDWARHSQNATNDGTVLSDALHTLEESMGNNDGLKKSITDAEVTGRIDKILGSGLSAEKKTARLMSIKAELNVYQKNMATDYLQRTAPALGIDYLEYNEYMPQDHENYGRTTPNVASDKAADGHSIMAKYKFATNTSGQNANAVVFANEDGSSLRVVPKANTWAYMAKGGSIKESGTGVKTMVAFLHKKYGHGLPTNAGQRVATDGVVVNTISRNTERKDSKTASQVAYATANEFDSGDISRLRTAGQTLPYIYKFACTKVGEHQAAKALSAWLSGQKMGGELVLPSVDVKFLASLGYHGAREEKKVAKAGSAIHKVKDGAPVDGHAILAEYDLTEKKIASDINTDGYKPEEIELGGTFEINL